MTHGVVGNIGYFEEFIDTDILNRRLGLPISKEYKALASLRNQCAPFRYEIGRTEDRLIAVKSGGQGKPFYFRVFLDATSLYIFREGSPRNFIENSALASLKKDLWAPSQYHVMRLAASRSTYRCTAGMLEPASGQSYRREFEFFLEDQHCHARRDRAFPSW